MVLNIGDNIIPSTDIMMHACMPYSDNGDAMPYMVIISAMHKLASQLATL